MKSRNTYYIFRHGETFASKNKVDYGDKEFVTGILPEGIPSIRRLGEYLKNIKTDKNYTSEFLRCLETVEIITKITDKKFEKELIVNEYLKNHGESFDKFRDRMKRAVEKFESEEAGFLICTHGAVASAFKYLLLTGKYEIENLRDYPETGQLMMIKEGKVEVLDFNDS